MRDTQKPGWEQVDGRDNALNTIRFILASCVLLSHSWPLTGHAEEPGIGGIHLGTWSVYGFFAISGYLIAQSRLRLRFAPFLWRRVLRIFPGLWVVVLLTAFVLAPVASAFAGQGAWSLGAAARYTVENGLLYANRQDIGQTLSSVSYPQAWNGSLWTLLYEFAAYLAIAAVLTGAWLRRFAPVVLTLLLLCICAANPWVQDHVALSYARFGGQLAPYFISGSLLALLRHRIPLKAGYAAGALVAVVVILSFLPPTAGWQALPIAYLTLWLGAVLPVRAFTVDDPSYGIYIYAFPVQQTIAAFLAPTNPLLMFAVAAPITFACAWLSWRLVEKPALKLKSRVGGAPRGRHHARSTGAAKQTA